MRRSRAAYLRRPATPPLSLSPLQSHPAAHLLALIAMVLYLTACKQQPAPPSATTASALDPPWFEDITRQASLVFHHEVEVTGYYLMPEQTGSGCALFDYDNDGRLDAYLIHNTHPSSNAVNRLFHQQSDGTFKDVSPGSGLDVTGYGMGLACADVDNDGYTDVVLAENAWVRLFHNQRGTGRFRDITAEAGITNALWAVPVAFLDYDRDGWLDLIIGNYLEFDPSKRCYSGDQLDFCGPGPHRPTVSKLYRNVTARAPGRGPRFEDVTVPSGLARWSGKAMGIVCADFDGDRWPDIMITDDALPNRLFVNQRNGTFNEQAVRRGLAFTGLGGTASNMGIALGDVNEDGLFDVFVPHLTEENHTLWIQGPPGFFEDRTAQHGLMAGAWHGTGFAPMLADFDNNGTLDLLTVNGAVNLAKTRQRPGTIAPDVPPFWAPYAHLNQLFCNENRGRFRDISAANPALCGLARVGRGLACGDLDNDGGLDLLISYISGPAQLLRNVAPARGHWIGIRAVDPAHGGRDAIGAEITVRAGTNTFWRLVQPCYSYCSSNDPRQHFGLGTATRIESIRIIWPDGAEETFPGPAVDQYVTLRKGAGQAGVRAQ